MRPGQVGLQVCEATHSTIWWGSQCTGNKSTQGLGQGGEGDMLWLQNGYSHLCPPSQPST